MWRRWLGFNGLKHAWQRAVELFYGRHEPLRLAFVDDHLVRRKFILSRASEFFKQDKFTPAPLLGLQLLDIGCGDTRMAQELAFRGAEVLGIDPDERLIFQARANAEKMGSPAEFMATSAERLVTEGRRFDVILCLDLFQHVHKLDQLLWAASRLLKDDGLLIFSTTNRTWWSWFFEIFMAELWYRWRPRGTSRYQKFIRPTELQRLFNRHRLTPDKLTGFLFTPLRREWVKTSHLHGRYMGVAYRTPQRD